AEALAHAEPGFAARPLAAGSVSQRPGMTVAIASRLHEIAQRAARTGNDNEAAFGCNRALAMNPNRLTVPFATRDAVVTAVPEALGLRSERGCETLRDQFAIGPGPANRQIGAAEIFLRRNRFRFHSFAAMQIHMVAQDGFTQAARAAVNEHDQLLLVETNAGELSGVEDLLDRLQFGEVIAAADCTERRIEFRGFKIV